MGVDFYACKECGEIFHDCGDEWYICENDHRVCKYCLGVEDGKSIEQDDSGYVNSKDCPVCQEDAEIKAKKPKVNIVPTWLLVRDDSGIIIGHYDNLSGARKRRTALKNLSGSCHRPTTIVKVSAVEGCEYPE